jgi:hypothetical protein
MQQAGVDAVALGEHFVQLHRAEHGTNVGHRQVDDRQLQVADLIGGRRVDHLNKAHRVDGDVGVILEITSCEGISSTCSIMLTCGRYGP